MLRLINVFSILIAMCVTDCSSGSSQQSVQGSEVSYGQVFVNGANELSLTAISDSDIQDAVTFELIFKDSKNISNLEITAISSNEHIASVLNKGNSNTCIVKESGSCQFIIIPHQAGRITINFTGQAFLFGISKEKIEYPELKLPSITAKIGSIYISGKNKVISKGLTALNLTSAEYLTGIVFDKLNDALYFGSNEKKQGIIYVQPQISSTTHFNPYKLGKLPVGRKISNISTGIFKVDGMSNSYLFIADSHKGVYKVNDLETLEQDFLAESKLLNVVQDFLYVDTGDSGYYTPQSLYTYDIANNFYHYTIDRQWEIIGKPSVAGVIDSCTTGGGLIYCIMNDYQVPEVLSSSKVEVYNPELMQWKYLDIIDNPFKDGLMMTKIYFVGQNKFYIGDNQGGLYIFVNNSGMESINLDKKFDFSGQSIKYILHGSDNKLFVGTYDRQKLKDRLYVLKNGFSDIEEITWFSQDILSIKAITINY